MKTFGNKDEKDVYELAQERIELLFNEFDNIYILFRR